MPNLTFEVRCPEDTCGEEFDLEIPAGHDMTEGGIVTCPGKCGTEWDWIQDEQGTIILFDDDEDLEDDEEEEDGAAAVIVEEEEEEDDDED